MDNLPIASLVRFHRKRSGLSQAELAQIAGVGKTAVFDIEKGKPTIQLDTLLKVLHILNIRIQFVSPLMELFKEQLIKKAKIFVNKVLAGMLYEVEKGKKYRFTYLDNYRGASVSLEMPLTQKTYEYDKFPPFFDGILPEGIMLDSLLRSEKIDRYDYLSQLIAVGKNVVGNVTIEAAN